MPARVIVLILAAAAAALAGATPESCAAPQAGDLRALPNPTTKLASAS